MIIEVAPSPIANAGADTSFYCGASTLSLDGSASTGDLLSYQWSGPGINQSNQNLVVPLVTEAGTYILEVTNSFGCTDLDTVIVGEGDLPPTADAGPNHLLTCDVPTAKLAASTNSAHPLFTWSGPGIDDSNRHEQNPIVTWGGRVFSYRIGYA